jgi:4-hydroxybenzoate polyprenyltransferase
MLRALIKSMRPKQWTKNVFIFAALVFDHQLFPFNARQSRDPLPTLRTLAGLVLLCMLSSTVYLINDLADVEKDRLHPTKRNRPLASGALNKQTAVIAAILLPAVALPLAFALGLEFGLVAVVYLVSNLLYSFRLKHVVIVDVLLLALFYILRVYAGVALITVERFSPWLYICMGLGALFIGFGKRRGELLLAQSGQAGNSRKVLDEYSLPYLDEMINLVATASVMAYSLYTFSAEGLPQNHAMMLTIPFVLYGILRYLYLIHMKGEGGAPDELIFTDRPLQITVILWGLAAVLILYLSPPR